MAIRARQALQVLAWVPDTGGRHHQVRDWAGEWTPRAVHLRWSDNTGAWDLWVHAADVQRSPTERMTGTSATIDPTSSPTPMATLEEPARSRYASLHRRRRFDFL